jgi:outer membrane lipoprotein-sorting protein
MAVLAVTLASSGCPTSVKKKLDKTEVLVAKSATADELITAYNQQAAAAQSLNARVELNPVAGSAYSGVIEDYHDVRGFILAQRPASVRMIGQAPVVAKNIFDMVSDGQTFRIFIPSKHKFIVGPTSMRRETEKPIENLRPHHLVDALFWTPIPVSVDGRPQALFEEQDEFSPDSGQVTRRYYVFTVTTGGSAALEVARKIWFDRTDLTVARVQTYEPGGHLVTDVHYSGWQPADAVASGEPLRYPRFVRIARPQDDYRLDVRITKLTMNETITADRFQLAQPEGTELVELTASGEVKKP